MQTAASNSLVLTDLTSFIGFADSQTAISHAEFYQRIASDIIRSVHTKQVLLELGDRLIAVAENAHAFRQMETIERVSQILVSLPLPQQYEAVGRYYQAVCTQSFGQGDIWQASSLLERVAENGPARYRAKALISLGANRFHQSDNRSALSLYYEASRFALRDGVYDLSARLATQRMIGVINGFEGNHRDAVRLLENLYPLAHAMRSAQPHVYYDYLNSLAVELCDVGRFEEAGNVSEIVLTSPFAGAYPEWRETREEIEFRTYRRSRATVAVSGRTSEVGNLVCLPVPDRQDSAGRQEHTSGHATQQARVLDLLEWKKKMGKEPNGSPSDKKSYKEMDGREMLLKIMELTGSSDRTDHELERILEAIDTVLSEPRDKGKQ